MAIKPGSATEMQLTRTVPGTDNCNKTSREHKQDISHFNDTRMFNGTIFMSVFGINI